MDVVLGAPAGVVGGADQLAGRLRGLGRGLLAPLDVDLVLGVGLLGHDASLTGEKESCLAMKV